MEKQLIIITTKEELQSLLKEVAPKEQQEQKENDRLLRRSEVKDLFKISYGTLNKWMKRGVINYTKVGRVPFFSEQEIIEAIKTYNDS